MPNDSPKFRRKETIEEAIDENLRRVYQEILREGTPPRFQELLERLQRARPPEET